MRKNESIKKETAKDRNKNVVNLNVSRVRWRSILMLTFSIVYDREASIFGVEVRST